MTRLWAGQPRKFGSISSKGKTFFHKIFRLLLMPTQPLVNYYWGLFPHGQRAMHLITHVCYVLSLRMNGAIPHPPYTFMPFTPTMVSLSGRSYTTDRQTDGNTEGEGMHVQLTVLSLMISFKLFLSQKVKVTA